jgi:outer membrane protein TolC
MIAAAYEKTFLLALEDVENAFAHTVAVEQRNRFLQAETASRATLNSIYRAFDLEKSLGCGNGLSM